MEFTHPKFDGVVHIMPEVFEFNQELTATEIRKLENQLGKTIRKLE